MPLKRSHSKKRMGWDLNPRDAFTSAGFQGRRSPSGHSLHKPP
jgi:hypothetical protein